MSASAPGLHLVGLNFRNVNYFIIVAQEENS